MLANLFMHYAFDTWLEREFPAVEFERYADDALVHCVTERQALQVRAALVERMEQVGLRLHPDKTKIVYCKDDNRPRSYEHESFTFLGYEFRARSVRSKNGVMFTAFTPAISPEALKKISGEVRSWRIHRLTRHSLQEIADGINPAVRGWMTYYGRFTPAALHPAASASTATWCAGRGRNTGGWPRSSARKGGGGTCSTGIPVCSRTGNGRALSSGLDEKSGVNREVHAPICGSPGARFPRATRLERAGIDGGRRPGTTSDDRKHITELERENRELRRANEILRAASSMAGGTAQIGSLARPHMAGLPRQVAGC